LTVDESLSSGPRTPLPPPGDSKPAAIEVDETTEDLLVREDGEDEMMDLDEEMRATPVLPAADGPDRGRLTDEVGTGERAAAEGRGGGRLALLGRRGVGRGRGARVRSEVVVERRGERGREARRGRAGRWRMPRMREGRGGRLIGRTELSEGVIFTV
jgi:hypothetical protein